MQRAWSAGFGLVVLCSCDDSMLGLGGSSPGCIPAEEFGAESGPIEDDFLPSDSPMRGGSGRPTKRICRTPMVASKPPMRPSVNPSEPWTLGGVSQQTAATDRPVTLQDLWHGVSCWRHGFCGWEGGCNAVSVFGRAGDRHSCSSGSLWCHAP